MQSLTQYPNYKIYSDYEVSFLRLLEAITNGGVIEISYTGELYNIVREF